MTLRFLIEKCNFLKICFNSKKRSLIKLLICSVAVQVSMKLSKILCIPPMYNFKFYKHMSGSKTKLFTCD